MYVYLGRMRRQGEIVDVKGFRAPLSRVLEPPGLFPSVWVLGRGRVCGPFVARLNTGAERSRLKRSVYDRLRLELGLRSPRQAPDGTELAGFELLFHRESDAALDCRRAVVVPDRDWYSRWPTAEEHMVLGLDVLNQGILTVVGLGTVSPGSLGRAFLFKYPVPAAPSGPPKPLKVVPLFRTDS